MVFVFYHFFGVLCFIIFLGFWDVFVNLPVATDQELATRTRQNDIQNLVHHVLTMHRLGPELVAEFLRDEHRDGATLEPSNRSLEMVVDQILVADRTKLLGAPGNGCAVDESPCLLISLEDDEELSQNAPTLALVVLHLPGREVAELAHRLALELVDVFHVGLPVILGPLIAIRLLIIDIHRVAIATVLAEPGVGAGLAGTINRDVAVHVERRSQHPRTLATIAMAHLVADRLENLVVGQLRGNLDDHRTDLEPTRRGVDMSKHLLGRRLGNTDDAVAVVIDLAPVDRRRIGQDAIGRVVGVGDADATVTISDPQTRLRDDGVGTIVSGERHLLFLLSLERESFEKFEESWLSRITLY